MKRFWMLGIMVMSVAAAAQAEPALRQATVVSHAGSVQWQQAGQGGWQPAAEGALLGAGDVVKTGPDGQTVLRLDDQSTLELGADTQVNVQTLTRQDSGARQTILGVTQGRLLATIMPVEPGSVVRIETPKGVIDVPPSLGDPTFLVVVNADGSVSVSSQEGAITLLRENNGSLRASLETGEQAVIDFDAATGLLRVTNAAGTFDVTGPNNKSITLAQGDSVTFNTQEGADGAATFIPSTPPVNAPGTQQVFEPASGS